VYPAVPATQRTPAEEESSKAQLLKAVGLALDNLANFDNSNESIDELVVFVEDLTGRRRPRSLEKWVSAQHARVVKAMRGLSLAEIASYLARCNALDWLVRGTIEHGLSPTHSTPKSPGEDPSDPPTPSSNEDNGAANT